MGSAPENTWGSFAKALELGVDGIALDVRLCRGLKVITWTVDRLEDIKKIMDRGVDGIISNYPERLWGFK